MMPTTQVDTLALDLSNPGQYFACCGLLEIASRLSPGSEGWFADGQFLLQSGASLQEVLRFVRDANVTNTMTAEEKVRHDELSQMKQSARNKSGLEDEKKELDALRRESPILLQSTFEFRIDWFRDDFSGGSRFKTWAGQQSVLEIASAMQEGLRRIPADDPSLIWQHVRGIGVPFNFDSDLGNQGSALDVGFSFDPLAASSLTRIGTASKPGLELLAFVGLQRFRPKEVSGENRFIYVAWREPLPPNVASAAACGVIPVAGDHYEFRLLYRTKYLKSFLPSIRVQGDDNE